VANDILHNAFQIFEHLNIPEPYDFVTARIEISGPFAIMGLVLLKAML